MALRKCPTQDKDCYPTQSRAIMAALRCSRKRGTPLRVYFHKGCGSFHITKKTKIVRSSVDTNDSRKRVA